MIALLFLACLPVTAVTDLPTSEADTGKPAGSPWTGAEGNDSAQIQDTAEPAGPQTLTIELLELDTAPVSSILDIVESLGRVFILAEDGSILDATDDSTLPVDGDARATSLLWRIDAGSFCSQVSRPSWEESATELACWNDLGDLVEQGAPTDARYFGSGLGHTADGTRIVLEGGDTDAPSALWADGEKLADWWPTAGPYGSQLVEFEGQVLIAAAGYVVALDPETGSVGSMYFPGSGKYVETLGPSSATVAEEFAVINGDLYYTSTISGTTRYTSAGWSSSLVGGSEGETTTVFWPTELRTGEVWTTGKDGTIYLMGNDGSLWSGAVYGAEAACHREGSLRVWPVNRETGEFVWACRGSNLWGRSQIVTSDL